jgi:hypothetical protein
MGNLFSSKKIQYKDIPSPDNTAKKEVCTNTKIRMAPFCSCICERIYSKDIDTLA